MQWLLNFHHETQSQEQQASSFDQENASFNQLSFPGSQSTGFTRNTIDVHLFKNTASLRRQWSHLATFDHAERKNCLPGSSDCIQGDFFKSNFPGSGIQVHQECIGRCNCCFDVNHG